MAEYNKEDIKGIECKHAIYTKADSSDRGIDDLVFIKEVVHLKDGRRIPQTRRVVNFERPFWVTKKGFRNHEQKKEYEEIEKCDQYTSTEANLQRSIKRALGTMSSPVYGLRKIAQSPYLYGADITSTAIIKRKYMDSYPDCQSPNSVAVLDIETDVNIGHGDPIYIAITFKDKAVMTTTQEYVKHVGIENFEDKMHAYFYKRLPDIAKERNISLEVKVCDNPVEAIRVAINKAHEWMPDFLAIWNINFDIPKIIECIEKYGGDVGDIFADPSVPKQFRKVWYKVGTAKKVTASGKEMALPWQDRWHTFYIPASFYVIDQACVFRKLRVARGLEPSYALDAILQKYAGTKKLKNDKADQMTGLEWHEYMQKHEPLEYGAYNLYDCISCEILDEQPHIGDLRLSLPTQILHSDYDKFGSQPRRTADILHFVYLEKGKVIGTTSDNLKTEYDSMTTSIDGWISTLPAHLVTNNGLQCIKEIPNLRTLAYSNVYD